MSSWGQCPPFRTLLSNPILWVDSLRSAWLCSPLFCLLLFGFLNNYFLLKIFLNRFRYLGAGHSHMEISWKVVISWKMFFWPTDHFFHHFKKISFLLPLCAFFNPICGFPTSGTPVILMLGHALFIFHIRILLTDLIFLFISIHWLESSLSSIKNAFTFRSIYSYFWLLWLCFHDAQFIP